MCFLGKKKLRSLKQTHSIDSEALLRVGDQISCTSCESVSTVTTDILGMGDVHRRACLCCHPCLRLFSPSWASIRLGGDIRVILSPSETQHFAEAAWANGCWPLSYMGYSGELSPTINRRHVYFCKPPWCCRCRRGAADAADTVWCCRCSPVSRMSGAIISVL